MLLVNDIVSRISSVSWRCGERKFRKFTFKINISDSKRKRKKKRKKNGENNRHTNSPLKSE